MNAEPLVITGLSAGAGSAGSFPMMSRMTVLVSPPPECQRTTAAELLGDSLLLLLAVARLMMTEASSTSCVPISASPLRP